MILTRLGALTAPSVFPGAGFVMVSPLTNQRPLYSILTNHRPLFSIFTNLWGPQIISNRGYNSRFNPWPMRGPFQLLTNRWPSSSNLQKISFCLSTNQEAFILHINYLPIRSAHSNYWPIRSPHSNYWPIRGPHSNYWPIPGDLDCQDGSDEARAGCEDRECRDNEFRSGQEWRKYTNKTQYL